MIIPLKRDVFEKDLKKKTQQKYGREFHLLHKFRVETIVDLHHTYMCRPLNFIFILKFSKQHMYMYVEM